MNSILSIQASVFIHACRRAAIGFAEPFCKHYLKRKIWELQEIAVSKVASGKIP